MSFAQRQVIRVHCDEGLFNFLKYVIGELH